ncbi:acyltransferase [Serratia marcescens]|uniref:acyltransferase n=1 Tax=Serratia marcescens TaxID=615 RepID=UPI0039E7C1C7
MRKNLAKLWGLCKKTECSFFCVVVKSFFYRILGAQNLFAANAVEIKGVKRITAKSALLLGLRNVGHISNKTKSFFNIRGQLLCEDIVSFGRGCKVDVDESAIFTCHGGYIGPENTFIIYNGLHIGSGCNISWGCQFLDDDFHAIYYENKKKEYDNIIKIGNCVWIGCNVSIFKGVHIASGCVVAANSVVTGVFLEENCLIAGNPAKVVKKNISWEL